MKNQPFLRRVLWADALLGGSTALIGLLFFTYLTKLLGLPTNLIIGIAVVTLLYALIALRLATQRITSIPLLRTLVAANWVWTAVSLFLFFVYFRGATALGVAFLTAQVLAVGGLAYVEGRQFTKR